MTKDNLNAVILRLQGSATECFQVIKDKSIAPLEDGAVDSIAQQAMRLANLEGAIVTLQQYAATIETYGSNMQLARAQAILEAQEIKAATPRPPAETEQAITEEELASRSPTFRRSQTKSKSKKRTKKNE